MYVVSFKIFIEYLKAVASERKKSIALKFSFVRTTDVINKNLFLKTQITKSYVQQELLMNLYK